MTKPVVLLSALAAAVLLVVGGALFLNPDRGSVLVHFRQGQSASQLFLPTKSQPEERIVRHPMADGGAVDDVLMRDGTTKKISYDSHMVLRHVFAYFKGAKPEVQGPLMYEKAHNANGHLESERHLRLDGSLEMDGLFGSDGTYVRHLYRASIAPDLSQAPANGTLGPVVQTEQTFDKAWRHTSQTDFRPDGTRQTVHTWGTSSDEVVTTLADDGKTIVSVEGTKGGRYYTAVYYPDNQHIKADVLNSYQGTTVQWYKADDAHTVALTITFDNNDVDHIVIPDAAGKPLINQVWTLGYSGQEQRLLDHVDHLNSAGLVDIKYEFDHTTHLLNAVTFYQQVDKVDKPYGARIVYTVGPDGWATKVETFSADNSSDHGKELTPANGRRFVLEPWMVTRPTYELPKLKDGIKLYGDPPNEEYDYD